MKNNFEWVLAGKRGVGNLRSIIFYQSSVVQRKKSSLGLLAVTVGLHLHADTLDCIASFLLPNTEAHVRYDLPVLSDTIRSLGSFLYDINLGATATTILRIRGVQIPINLVNSATDSYRRSVVLFKPMSVPTSDPKSEFLYQLSCIVHNLQTSP